MSENEILIDYRCVRCKKIAGRIKEGSKIAKGAGLICDACQKKWQEKLDLLKKSAEMFRQQAQAKGAQNPYSDILRDLFKK